jgi:hypothetical protein
LPFPQSPSRGFVDMSLIVAKRLGLIAAVVIAAGACSPQSSVAAAQGQVQQDSQPAPVAIPARRRRRRSPLAR